MIVKPQRFNAPGETGVGEFTTPLLAETGSSGGRAPTTRSRSARRTNNRRVHKLARQQRGSDGSERATASRGARRQRRRAVAGRGSCWTNVGAMTTPGATGQKRNPRWNFADGAGKTSMSLPGAGSKANPVAFLDGRGTAATGLHTTVQGFRTAEAGSGVSAPDAPPVVSAASGTGTSNCRRWRDCRLPSSRRQITEAVSAGTR